MKAVVVGGGIVGSAVSLELQRRGWEVTTLDDAPGATPIATGVLLPDSSQRATEGVHGRWCGESLAAWQGDWLRLPMQKGVMFFIRDEASQLAAERYRIWARGEGLFSEKISPKDTALPLGEEVLRETSFLLHLPEAMVLNTEAVLPRLHARIRLVREKARQLLVRGGKVRGVLTASQEIAADVVVGACGWRDWSWSPVLPRLLPWQGERILFEGFREQMPLLQTGEGALAARGDGTLWAGVSFREDRSGKPLASATAEILRRAIAWLPGLRDARIASVAAGIRPGTADYLPLLGETSVPGFYLATGHGRGGILSAPFSAGVLADIIEQRGSPWQEALSPERSLE